MILRETFALTLFGIAIGIPAGLAASRLIASMLFGLSPSDLSTIVTACLLLLAVAFFAGYLPARKASCIDPVVALRTEQERGGMLLTSFSGPLFLNDLLSCHSPLSSNRQASVEDSNPQSRRGCRSATWVAIAEAWVYFRRSRSIVTSRRQSRGGFHAIIQIVQTFVVGPRRARRHVHG
jgi:hypothetical protein